MPREAAYDGRFAATRLEHVHFRGAAGEPLSADVHVVVNVSTDPSLRQLALDDTLHVVRGGPPLAVPYVFHDPAAKKFALVLPIALRHHEFAERAQLLLALGEDESAAIPAYVRAARVCVGAVELAAYLREQGPGETAERPLDARSDEDLRERESFLERSFADLAIREQALAERLALLQEREEIAAGVHDAETSAGEYLAADGLESQRRLDGALTADEADDFEEDEDVEEEEVDEGELDAVEDVSPDEVLDADSQVGEPVPDVAFVEEDRGPALADDPGRISSVEVDTDEFEALEALEGPDMEATYVAEGYEDVTGPHPRTLPPSETPSSEAFFTRSAQEMAIDDSRRGVTLLVRLTEGKEGVFADPQNPAELLVQLMDVQDYPVVVLALMQRGERRPYVRREVLDPCTPAHRRVLEQLAERFAAEAIVYAADGRSVGTFELVGNRELNVTRVLEAVDAMSIPVDVDRAAVLERALAAPPPAGGSGHPFGEPDSHPVPSELVALLPLLDKWASLEQQSRAALVLSVPVPDIETVLDRRIQEALERGLHLPTALEEEAIRRGFAVDAAALVGTAIRAFPNTVGLVGRSQAADNWEQLLTRAMDLDVPVEDATVEAAWEAIRQVRGAVEDQAELASLDAGKLDSLSVRALTAVLHHPTLRGAALRALATRGEGVDPEEVVQAFGKLPASSMVDAVGALVGFGDRAGDSLLALLDSPHAHVRHAAVIALGAIRLRRSIVPLTEHLSLEPTRVWREIARVLASFGSSSFRSLSRSFRDPKGLDARFAYALAHMANQGSEADVKRLAASGDPTAERIAKEALALRDEAARDAAECAGDLEPSADAPERATARALTAALRAAKTGA